MAVKGVLSDMYKGAEQAGAHKFAVTGQGPFGPVFGNLAGDPENAIAHLLRSGEGSVPGAAVNHVAGPVTFVAGAPVANGPGAFGVLHIDAKGRPDVLDELPAMIKSGTPYSRVQKTKSGVIQPKGGREGWYYLGDGEKEALLRGDFNFSPTDQPWNHTAYRVDADKRLPVGDGRLSSATGFAATVNFSFR